MDYVMDLRKVVGNRPLILTGSCVLIINNKNELLLQERSDGGWGLPGGLMELGESLEETARREVKEETGLIIGKLKLLDVFSGTNYYFKFDNGDEIYSVTAIYVTNEFEGILQKDDRETIDLKFFNLGGLPSGLTEEYKNYIGSYFKSPLL